jgi:hypothetical protein
MGAALPLVRSLYTWSMRSEMWLYALLNNSVLREIRLTLKFVKKKTIPPLFHIVERIPRVFGVFASFLSLFFRISKLILDIIEPKHRVVSLPKISSKKTCRSMAFMLGVIRSISALSFVIEASNSPSTSPEGFCVDAEAIP